MRKALPTLLAIYALLTVGLQYLSNAGQKFPFYLYPLSTLLGFLIALFHAATRFKWTRALWLLGSAFVVSLAFESVGVLTGLIYGPYHYTQKLGYLFLGLVPLIIPIAWFMMMYPSFVIADWIVPGRANARAVWVAAAGAIVMTAWDVVMDPVMVKIGHWVWDVNGPYFGIPLQNFFGWWLTTFVAFMVFLWLGKPLLADRSDPQFDKLTVILFCITALGSILGALSGGLGGAALAGIFAVSPWMIFGWMKMSE